MGTRSDAHDSQLESNARMRSKINSTELKNTKSNTFLDRILAFDSTGESCALARDATANCSQIPDRSAPSKGTRLTVLREVACYRDTALYYRGGTTEK